MATALQLRRGTTAQNNAFTGAAGELSYDTATEGLIVHDGSTAGGFEIMPSGSIIAFGGAVESKTSNGFKVSCFAALVFSLQA